MYQSIQSFIADYGNESRFTQKLLSSLTDASLKQEFAPDIRSIRTLADSASFCNYQNSRMKTQILN